MEIVLGKKCSQICETFTSKTLIFGKRYRSSFEIIALILEAACDGASRFAVANHLKTNYILLHKYLDYLVRIGFVDVEHNGRQILYRTSKKGFEFLKLYHSLLKMLLDVTEEKMIVNVAYQRTRLRSVNKS
ncbi:MAG: winged helix-turn-helix domain-containing protein [Candidatus Bathyarchaeia archaeon]